MHAQSGLAVHLRPETSPQKVRILLEHEQARVPSIIRGGCEKNPPKIFLASGEFALRALRALRAYAPYVR